MYKKKKVKKSEALQLILLDNIYAQSGSEHIIFQGGTALRWIYSGMRFSEDLDFVTHLQAGDLEKILSKMFQNTKNACIAQFGPGQAEFKSKGVRKQATKMFFIYRPENQRESCALPFSTLNIDISVMVLYRSPYHRHAQARSTSSHLLFGVERFKYLVYIIRGNTDPGVGDRENHVITLFYIVKTLPWACQCIGSPWIPSAFLLRPWLRQHWKPGS